MTYKTYEEARVVALSLKKESWIFENPKSTFTFPNVGFFITDDNLFKFCCEKGAIPCGHVIVTVECIEMFTGVVLDNKLQKENNENKDR